MKDMLNKFAKFLYDTYHKETFDGKYCDAVIEEEAWEWFGLELSSKEIKYIKEKINFFIKQETTF